MSKSKYTEYPLPKTPMSKVKKAILAILTIVLVPLAYAVALFVYGASTGKFLPGGDWNYGSSYAGSKYTPEEQAEITRKARWNSATPFQRAVIQEQERRDREDAAYEKAYFGDAAKYLEKK